MKDIATSSRSRTNFVCFSELPGLLPGRRCYEDHNGIFVRLSSRNKLFARSHGPADQWHSRFAERDDHNRRQTTAAIPPEIWRRDHGDRRWIEELAAAACGASQGCAERATRQ